MTARGAIAQTAGVSSLCGALEALDALHREDPVTIEVRGETVAAEFDYARRMTSALMALDPSPSEALQLAIRAQHLQRWLLPRTDYPMNREGYHAWRTAQRRAHAELALETLRPLGFPAATLERVADLVMKKNRGRDPEAQTLEDAACLVFLETQLASFGADREEEQLVNILKKTWAKMSERARAVALELDLEHASRRLLTRALA